jgi:type I restriction enzyme M protein
VQLINGVDLFQKMRKSLGNKRHELSKDHIETIAKTYGDIATGGIAKVFDNIDFGYCRIVVERPLQLNFQATPERIERLHEQSAFAGLGKSKKKGAAGEREAEQGRMLQGQILAVLRSMATNLIKNREAFEKMLRAALNEANVELPTPVFKSIISALSERDESADICKDSKGHPEPDSDLRDTDNLPIPEEVPMTGNVPMTENVPLNEHIEAYFKREVIPHVPNAWFDRSKTKIGYEIPFTRHFYNYKPLRPLLEIEVEIRKLAAEIDGMLGQVLL